MRETGLVVVVEAGEAALPRLEAVLAAVEVQSVLLRPAVGRTLEPAAARPLVEAAQKRGAAGLIANDARLARTLRADGVHLDWTATGAEAFASARELLGRGAIVGCDSGRSRHDAMEQAEAGADYIGFARTGDLTGQLDIVQWWAEIFEVPAVAFDVADAADAAALAEAGADFIALRLSAGAAPGAAARHAAACIAAARGRE